ncbi:MAG: hypothetical protein H0V70_25890 [Ktedonobacteraceae bacterium]|nr:hypothetical protein [Ktedonobacteraceae bacterium]
MPPYYVSTSGDDQLHPYEIEKIAMSLNGTLLAIDGIDASNIAAGKTFLPKATDEKRDYLFFIEAVDKDAAEYVARDILETARTERDKPVYNNFLQFLHASLQAPWRDRIRATLLHDEDDQVDLLLFVPGQSENDPAKIYYRGQAASCCLDLLKHFMGIPVKK